MKRILSLATLCATLLGGCSTVSFAPPPVRLKYRLVDDADMHIGDHCTSLNATKPDPNDPGPIQRNARGAIALIDNFVLIYRCVARHAADGRQYFEVPSMLAVAGAATAAAFGAGPDVAIAGGAANALLGAGKNYYAPKDKAAIYNSALDALLCIKTEAVGVDPVTVSQIGAAQTEQGGGAAGRQPAGGAAGGEAADAGRALFAQADVAPSGVATPTPEAGVQITYDEQYYDLIAASLFSVERVLAQRLSNVGSFDAAGVIAEIKALAKQAADTEASSKLTATGTAAALQTPQANATAAAAAAESSPQVKAQLLAMIPRTATLASVPTDRVASAIVKLETLPAQLDQCVVRAKI